MADEEDYNIESADAGASATIPMEAGQIKKGGCVSSQCSSVESLPGERQHGDIPVFASLGRILLRL
jgi:hypothetical protein